MDTTVNITIDETTFNTLIQIKNITNLSMEELINNVIQIGLEQWTTTVNTYAKRKQLIDKALIPDIPFIPRAPNISPGVYIYGCPSPYDTTWETPK